MGKIESKDKNHGLRGHESIYNVGFLHMACGMIEATAGDQGIAEFRINHTKRVADLALKLSADIKIDERKLKIACEVHDMYEYVTTQKHGKLAAKFLLNFVEEYYPQETGDKIEWRKAIEAVKYHSEKKVDSTNKYLDLLQDADTLDKLSVEYVNGWFSNFQAESIDAVVKMVIEKVNRYEGRTKSYQIMKAEMLEKLITHFGL